MQIIKNKEKAGNTLFYIGIILEIIIMMTDHSQIILPLRGRVAQLAFVLFGCKILTTKYTKKEWIVIILFGFLGAVSYLTCGEEYFARAIVMVTAAKEIELKKIAKTIFLATLAGTMLIVVLSLTGTLGVIVDVRNYGRGAEEARWCLGFSHANNVHDMFWYLLVFYFYLENKRCTWIHYLVLTIGNIGLYMLTISRTGFLTAQILIIGCAIVRYFPGICKTFLPYIAAVVGLAGCMYITILGGFDGRVTPIKEKLNALLTGRLQMVWEFARVSKWTWFPPARDLMYVDNGFARLFFLFGIVVGTVYLALLIYMAYHMYRTRNGVGVVILATTMLVTVMESTFIWNTSLLCNPVFFLLFNEWYKSNKDTVNEVRV